MNKIQGHGIPTKFKAAERGTVYTDLDTGKRYKCLGPKGFVNQDAVDEPLEYHWQLVNMVEDNQIPNGGVELPFGEKTVMGDTLTWDGNTEGLYNVYEALYHVSNIVPTLEDLKRGVILYPNDGSFVEVDSEAVIPLSESVIALLLDNYPIALVALVDNATASIIEGEVTILEKAGIYFALIKNNGFYNEKLTINGYKGFPRTEITPLPNKYLDIVETVGCDTLTWDGNTEGLKNYSDTTQFWKCRISDVTPTLDQLKNGVTVVQKSCDGRTREEIFEPFDAIEYYEYSHSAHGNGYQIQFEEYRQSNGIVIEKGIYFFNDGEREIYTAELKIPNFTVFPKEQVKQEYLPSWYVVEYNRQTYRHNGDFEKILECFKRGCNVYLKYHNDTYYGVIDGFYIGSDGALQSFTCSSLTGTRQFHPDGGSYDD